MKKQQQNTPNSRNNKQQDTAGISGNAVTYFRSYPDPVCCFSSHGLLVWCNPPFLGAFAVSRENLQQTTINELFPPDDQEQAEHILGNIREGRIPPPCTLRLPVQGKRWQQCNAFFVPLGYETADLPHMAMVVHFVGQEDAASTTDYKLAFEGLIMDVTGQLIGLEGEAFDIGIRSALSSIGEFSGEERLGIALFSEPNTSFERVYTYNDPALSKEFRSQPGLLDRELAPQFHALLSENGTIVLQASGKTRDDTQEITAAMVESGCRSLLLLAIIHGKTLLGFLAAESLSQPRYWPDDLVELLQVVAGIFGNAFVHRRSDLALQRSEELYHLIAEASSDGFWDWDLRSSTIYFSPRWKRMLGFEEVDLPTSPSAWFDRVHLEDIGHLMSRINTHIEKRTGHFEAEYQILHKNGSYRWMSCRGLAVWDEDGHPLRMVGSQTEITDRKQAEFQLLHDAFHDPVTELPNRALLMDRLRLAMARATRDAQNTFAVLFLDLDRFKVVNESLGHNYGDSLLRTVADRIKVYLRAEDTLARIGGDEFVILLENINSAVFATKFAGRVQKAMALPVIMKGEKIYPSLSIGIVIHNAGYQNPEDMLRDAEAAMYTAKNSGKAKYEIFVKEMHQQAIQTLQIESELRRAIDYNELEVFYQPIVSLSSNRVCGFEALLRWHHPERGLLSPIHFIDIAEETGLIVPIGEWVLSQACTQIGAWLAGEAADLYMSVNISGRQFESSDIMGLISKVLKQSGIPPHALQVEITESIAMKDLGYTINLLEKLRDMNVKISIDDFGTGYSSLGYLKRFPLTTLKVDKSFIRDLHNNDNDRAITEAIIAMAASLKLKVIAEGVETEAQLAFLRQAGCHMIQGYLFSRPQNASTAADLIHKPLNE